MPKYKYIVINKENQQLQGTVSAPDVESAKSELNQLGFSVIGIEEVSEEEQAAEEAGNISFEFSAIDKNGKQVAGTIQANDRYAAFLRLISEYQLEVQYLVQENLPEDQKEQEKIKGAIDLYNKMEEEKQSSKEKLSQDEKDLNEFKKKQHVLLKQISFVLEKVEELLNKYEGEMVPETKGQIKTKVEKLLRIKNSTNLDYVKKTAEDLLKYIQSAEIFLHKEKKMEERTQMVVEAKSLMMQLKKSSSKKSTDIFDAMRQWRNDHIVEKTEPGAFAKFLDFFVSIILGVKYENEKVLKLKEELQNTNSQIWQYVKLYFQVSEPALKQQTKSGLKNLWQRRKKLKQEIKDEKKKIIADLRAQNIKTTGEAFLDELIGFTGWLLTFYLIYYFVSLYLLTKDLGGFQVSNLFYIYKSAFLKYFLATLFIVFAALTIKRNFFNKNKTAGFIITPIVIIGLLAIYLNF
ncbi:hypothetical protein GF340_00195 [Candidatus Peregrinibacteria bacterium]|nr:hypothetical protein [Candidatus Peregrinibacteria bacterium]